jgi:hypothetical protein
MFPELIHSYERQVQLMWMILKIFRLYELQNQLNYWWLFP